MGWDLPVMYYYSCKLTDLGIRTNDFQNYFPTLYAKLQNISQPEQQVYQAVRNEFDDHIRLLDETFPVDRKFTDIVKEFEIGLKAHQKTRGPALPWRFIKYKDGEREDC
jgi:hypothetical protein